MWRNRPIIAAAAWSGFVTARRKKISIDPFGTMAYLPATLALAAQGHAALDRRLIERKKHNGRVADPAPGA
jgi:hypothetical protein